MNMFGTLVVLNRRQFSNETIGTVLFNTIDIFIFLFLFLRQKQSICTINLKWSVKNIHYIHNMKYNSLNIFYINIYILHFYQ